MSTPSNDIVFLISQTGYNDLFKATLTKEKEDVFKAILTEDGAWTYAAAKYPDLAQVKCASDEMAGILSGVQEICLGFVQDSIEKHLEKHEPAARPAALTASHSRLCDGYGQRRAAVENTFEVCLGPHEVDSRLQLGAGPGGQDLLRCAGEATGTGKTTWAKKRPQHVKQHRKFGEVGSAI